MTEERLQKVLAQGGFGSRRYCEELILAGRVVVDGRIVTELGTRVDPDVAEIRVDGRLVEHERLRYVILHKPVGYITGEDERSGYPSWQELVRVRERLYSVGRLDQDSEGLLLLTNDGELALHLSHPRFEHQKTYLVQVQGFPSERKVRRLQHGVMLDDGPTLPARVTLLRRPPPEAGKPPTREAGRTDAGRPGRSCWLRITLREGRKRQLRRMTALLGHPALRIIRVGIGPLLMEDLAVGKWRDLTPGEVRALHEAAKVGAIVTPLELDHREERATMPRTIAIDGPSASGKSTIGALLADELDYLYFDTGVMYRAVAAVALARKVPVHDEQAVTALAEMVRIEVTQPTVDDGRDVTVLADGEDITLSLRLPAVEKAVSPVSAYKGVRDAMRTQQRRIGEPGRVVMVGRDIGTMVLPDADLKIYLDAALVERAHRRYAQKAARGEKVDLERVLVELKARDEFDSNRKHAPLSPAKDAILVDSTGLGIDDVMERVRMLLRLWRRRK